MVLKNSLLVAFSIFSYFFFFQNKLHYESVIDSVVLVSDFQKELGCKSDFSPDCEITRFKKSYGLWKLSILVPAGDRQIKVVHNNRMYGQKGQLDGAAIHLILSSPANLLFTYDANTHLLSFAPISLESRSSLPPAVVSITLSDTLIYDPNANMVANPSDSIRYTMILNNQSGQSLMPTNLTRTSDPNTTIDSFFLKASPLAFNDTFPYDVHPKMVMAGLGLLANDYDLNDPLPNPPFNANLTVVRVNSMPLGGAIPTMGGGSVTVMSDGSFSYDSTNTNGATTDFFQYTVLDQDGFYDSAFVLIQFNEPPAIASNIPATDTICAFEQQDTFLMTSAFSISDDGTVIASAKVEICTNYLATEDTLIPGSLPGGITTAWTDGSGTLMLMGNASLADYETAIEGIQYLNQADAPNTSIREVCITVNDGISISNQVTRELKVKPINDCPVAVRDTVSIPENNNITMFNVLANDTDLESNMLSVTKINGGMSLSMVNISGGTINSLATNGILNFSHTTGFTGLDSLSAGEMFFTRFEYSMSDGSCEDSDSVIIKITGLNDAPLIASNLSATDTICAFEMQDTFLVTAAFTLLDDEDNTDSATIGICNNYLNSEDTLVTGALPGGIMAAWNDATGTLKLYGSTTKANYETAIKALQYLNSSNTPNTNTRRICITVHDGDLLSNQVTREMKVKPVNDCPVAVRDTLLVTENGSNMSGNVLTNDTDPESNVLSVTMVNASSANTNVVINGGTINIATGGAVTFTHTTGATGLDTLNLNQMFFARAQYTNSDGLCTDNDSVIIKITGINDAPIADSNKYSLAQTSTLSVVAPGILSDDDDIDNGSSITVGEVNGSAANVGVLVTLPSGADLTVNANGSFTYNPKCLVAGLDSFTYAAKDENNALSSTVKVYLQISQTMWFVDDVVTNGSGSFNSPFNTFTSVESQSQPGDYIFLFPGTYTQNLLLKNNQKLIGAIEDWLCPSGSTIRMATPSDITNFQGELSLAMNDTVKGIGFNSISTSPLLGLESRSSNGSIFIKDNNVSVGDLFMSNNRMIIANTARCGFVIKNGGSLNVTFNSFSIAGTGQTAIDLNSCNGNMTILAGNISTTGDTLINIKGGQLTATFNNSCTQSGNFPLLTVSDHSVGILTFQTGTISATSGTGLQFDNADGSYNFNGTTILGGGDAGIDIINGSGGAFTFTNTSITNPAGIAFLVNGGNGIISHTGAISKNNAGRLIDIQSRSGGSVTFNGILSSTTTSSGINVSSCTSGTVTFAGTTKTINTGSNNAITLATNTGSTTNFTNGGLDIDCTLGIGFTATGGGTISVQGSGNSITTTTSTALNVVNTSIGANNLNFQSISSNGGSATGIILNNTGSSGGLTVTGTGIAGSGGTIANKAGANTITTEGIGIYLNNCSNVSLSRMQLNDFSNYGIRGLSVNGFSMSNSNVQSNFGKNGDSDADNEGSIVFGTPTSLNGLTGEVSITNCIIEDGFEDNFIISNQTGTMSSFTMSNTTIQDNSTASPGNEGFAIILDGSASLTTANITNCTFQRNRANGIHIITESNSSIGSLNIGNATVGSGGTFTDNNIGIHIVHNGTGSHNFTLQNATLNTSTLLTPASPININLGGSSTAATSFNGLINANSVSVPSDGVGPGMRLITNGAGTMDLDVTNNTVTTANANLGLEFLARDGSSKLKAVITGNTITLTNSTASHGIQINSGAVTTDETNVCVKIGGTTLSEKNTISNAASVITMQSHIRVRNRFAGTIFGIQDLSPNPTSNTADVISFITARNVFLETAFVTATVNSNQFTACIP